MGIVALTLVLASVAASGGITFVFTDNVAKPLATFAGLFVEYLGHSVGAGLGVLLFSISSSAYHRLMTNGRWSDFSVLDLGLATVSAIAAFALQAVHHSADEIRTQKRSKRHDILGLVALFTSVALTWYAFHVFPLHASSAH